MRIAILSRYQGINNRGAESFVYELSTRLKRTHNVEILTNHNSDNLSLVFSGKYDLVIPMNGRTQVLKASLGRLIDGKYKILIIGQSGIGRDDLWNIIVGKPDVFVALTKKATKWAKAFAWGSKVAHIPNGVDTKKFNPDGDKLNFNLAGPIILSVGALEWYKGHQLVIKAASALKDVSLVIVGDGSQKKKLEEMGNQMLKDRFKILKTSYENMPSIYRSADVFTLPSWSREAFGIVYLEAMASNLPVVAPDYPTRREIIGDAGLYTDVNNIESYAQTLQQSLQIRWGNKPRKQADKFSWEVIAKRYNEILENL